MNGAPGAGSAGDRLRRLVASPWLHAAFVGALSAAWESVFRRNGLNPVDEGWPLYAAMRLHDGGRLYQDVFFVFPPGHLLSAWLAYAWHPPGLVLARDLITVFHVSLCVALYFLGRRLMPPSAALLGSTMLAVAAPDSHWNHYLFGYRQLVFTTLALLCFAQRLRTGDHRWMLASGALVGVGMLFRWDPALVAIAGIGAGVLVADRSARSWWADGVRFLAGFALVVGPVAVWLAAGVGWDALWREVFVRPVAMTAQQSLPIPVFMLPVKWDRWGIRIFFVTFQFALYTILYLAYAGALVGSLARALANRQPFESPLLLAVVIWGGLFYLRSFGRSDEAHLDSTLPASCLLIACAIGNRLRGLLEHGGRGRWAAQGVLAATLGAWIFLSGSDLYLDPEIRGTMPVAATGNETRVDAPHPWLRHIDRLVRRIQSIVPPGRTLLDVTGGSLIYVLSERPGPGYHDIVMPGTFLNEDEELAFLGRLDQAPPALVIASYRPFDDIKSRSLEDWAPLLGRWIDARYQVLETIGPFVLKTPRFQAGRPVRAE